MMFFLLFLEKPDQNSTEENIISQKLECTGTGINNIILIFFPFVPVLTIFGRFLMFRIRNFVSI